jgi:hypothetical protein
MTHFANARSFFDPRSRFFFRLLPGLVQIVAVI